MRNIYHQLYEQWFVHTTGVWLTSAYLSNNEYYYTLFLTNSADILPENVIIGQAQSVPLLMPFPRWLLQLRGYVQVFLCSSNERILPKEMWWLTKYKLILLVRVTGPARAFLWQDQNTHVEVLACISICSAFRVTETRSWGFHVHGKLALLRSWRFPENLLERLCLL